MIVSIALPIALQNLLTTLTQMMDSIMLGELGDVMLSSSSLANQIFFIFSLFIFGIGGGSAILMSQYWGKRDIEPIKIIMATVMRVVVFTSLIFMIVIYLFPTHLMSLYSSDPEVIAAGAEYLLIVAPMYFLFGISCTFTSLYRSIELVKIAVVTNIITLITNITLNYILIFGKFGAPRLELRGAAYATVIARTLEFCVVLWYVFLKDKRLGFKPSCMLKKDKILSKDLKKYCTPVVVNELVWAFGITLQAALFGQMSTTAVSANTIIGVVQNLGTLVIFGVANAAAVIIGKTIGQGDYDLAKARGKTIKILAVILGLCGAVVIILCRDFMVDFYNVAEETKILAKQMLIITAFVIFFLSNSAICIVGVLRGGGDTKFSLIIEVIALWGFSVPLGYIAGLGLGWPVLVVFALFKIDEVIKSVLCWIRLRGTKWINDVTRVT